MELLKQKLIKLGLTEIEASVYLILLNKKFYTASDVARTAGISRPKAYETLKSLIEKDICIKVHGNVTKFCATEPKTVMQKIKTQLEEKKDISLELSAQLSEIHSKITDNSNPLDYITVLHTKSQIYKQAQTMEEHAKKEILSFSKPPYSLYSIDLDNIENINKEQFQAFQRGVKYKSIYEAPKQNKQDFVKMLRYFEKGGEEVKVVKHLPMKMLIFDKKSVIYMLKNNSSSQTVFTAVAIKHKDITETLRITFDTLWKNSYSLDEYEKKI